jgi:competence protein ComEA
LHLGGLISKQGLPPINQHHEVARFFAGRVRLYDLQSKRVEIPLSRAVAMDPNSSAIPSGSFRPPPTPPALLTWPRSVQLALALIVVASLFFVLGRWSNTPVKAEADLFDHAGPALDLNRATKAELRLLPGLGDALAQRIVDFRERHGSFKYLDDLRQVSGIGPKTFDRIRPFLFVTQESFVSLDEDAPSERPIKPIANLGTSTNKASKLTQPINVNHAKLDDLQMLPGIGPKLSQRILDERAKAAFQCVDELRRVPGIGPKTLEKLRPFVVVE